MTGKNTYKVMRGVTCVGLLIGLLLGAAAGIWSSVVLAQSAASGLPVQQVQSRSMDRSLEGMRKGVLTSAQDGIIRIDGTTYALAVDALMENRTGGQLQGTSLRLDDVQYPVEYWLVPESAARQIARIVIYFPE